MRVHRIRRRHVRRRYPYPSYIVYRLCGNCAGKKELARFVYRFHARRFIRTLGEQKAGDSIIVEHEAD